MIDTTCEAEVEFDIGVYADCGLAPEHRGRHRAEVTAIGGIVTVVTWGEETPVEQQTWERLMPGTDAAELRVLLEVDGQGRAYVHEALLGRLLLDAGWERTR